MMGPFEGKKYFISIEIIYKDYKMDYVVEEINGLEVVKKRLKTWFI